MSAREDLAAAVETVSGLTCSPYYTQGTSPGDAHIRLDERVRDESGFGFLDTWHVVIVLGQDTVSAEQWIEEHSAELLTALSEEMWVTSLLPSEILIGATVVNGVIVVGVREHQTN